MELVMSFDKNDVELHEAIDKQFGEVVIYEESKGFNGLEILITAVVPVTALTVQIIDFIMNNFHSLESNEKKRVIIQPDGSIDLRGYTADEAREIIKTYFESQKDVTE